jgi:hypothetical protein
LNPSPYRRGVQFIFVDGSHQFEDVFVDFYFSSRLVNVDGTILFDDCADPHVRKVIKFIFNDYAEGFAEFSLDKYVKGPRRKLRRRVGLALGKVQMRAFRKIRDGNASLKFHDF